MTLLTHSSKTSLWSRADLMADLTARVSRMEAQGYRRRLAIRMTAAEVGLHPLRVKRLVDLYPEA